MAEVEGRAVHQALESVHDRISSVFAALLEPYAALADSSPDAAIGEPHALPGYVKPVDMHGVAESVVRNGRGGWALFQVDEREGQLLEFLQDYRRGLYRRTTASEWVRKVELFRDAVLADVNTALQAPRGWDRLDLSNRSARNGKSGGEDLLTPKDVAPELKLGERTVRRRILEGKLGPWRKEGSRWVIQRDAFWKYWSDCLLDSDSDVPHPPAPNHTAEELDARLSHVPLDPR